MGIFNWPANDELKLILKETFRELIDENLSHIIKECGKKPETKIIVDDDIYQKIKRHVRKEIADECRLVIAGEIYRGSLMVGSVSNLANERALENIMKIIRGE